MIWIHKPKLTLMYSVFENYFHFVANVVVGLDIGSAEHFAAAHLVAHEFNVEVVPQLVGLDLDELNRAHGLAFVLGVAADYVGLVHLELDAVFVVGDLLDLAIALTLSQQTLAHHLQH